MARRRRQLDFSRPARALSRISDTEISRHVKLNSPLINETVQGENGGGGGRGALGGGGGGRLGDSRDTRGTLAATAGIAGIKSLVCF